MKRNRTMQIFQELGRRARASCLAAAAAALLVPQLGCGHDSSSTTTASNQEQAAPENRPTTNPDAAEPEKTAEDHGESAADARHAQMPRDQASAPKPKPAAAAPARPAAEKPEPAAPPPAPAPRVTMMQVPDGKHIRTTLNGDLSSKTSQVGDRFEATVSQDVRDKVSRVIIIPVGSIVSGEVIEVRPAKALKGEALLSIRVNEVRLPKGEGIPLVASLLAEGANTTKRTVGGIAGGAVAGAILGKVIGKDSKDAAIGAAAGAAIGTGIVLGMDNKDVTVPSGAEMVFHVDEPVQVPVPNPQS